MLLQLEYSAHLYYSWAQADEGPISTWAFMIATAGEEDMADCTLALHLSSCK